MPTNPSESMVLHALDCEHGVGSMDVIRARLNWPANRITGRLADLEQKGLIFRHQKKDRSPLTGRKVIIYQTTKTIGGEK